MNWLASQAPRVSDRSHGSGRRAPARLSRAARPRPGSAGRRFLAARQRFMRHKVATEWFASGCVQRYEMRVRDGGARCCEGPRLWCRVRPNPPPRCSQSRDLRGVPPAESASAPGSRARGRIGSYQRREAPRRMRSAARANARRAAWGAFAALALGAGGARAEEAHDWQLGFQPAASVVRERIDFLHNVILLPIITVISLFVLGLLLWVMIRYNAKRNPVPSKISHNTTLEIAWTLVPILILVVIAIPSFKLLYFMDKAEHA